MPMQRRPNILLLCTDQQRYDTLGCTGSPTAQTPNLDGLAREGTLFDNCYVQNPICSPSRASLFTGKYPRNHGLWANGVSLPANNRLFTRALADAGYDCGMIGKQHLSACQDWRTEPRLDDGYRVFEWAHDPIHRSPQNSYLAWLRATYPAIHDAAFGSPVAGSSSDVGNKARGATPMNVVPVEAHFSHWVADRAIDFIAEPGRPAGKPFFLIANFFDPHHPFGAPADYRGRFNAEAIPPPIGRDRELDGKPAAQRDYSRSSYAGMAPGYLDYEAAEIQELRAAYHAMIALVDDEVGRVLAALADAGLAEDTLVVFTSDHGEMLGDHQMLLKGPMMYDSCTKVPLIMRWPGQVQAGQRRPELVQWIDLTSTFLEAAGSHGLPAAQGASLLALASGGDQGDWRCWAMCEYRDSGHPGSDLATTDPRSAGVHTTMLRWADWKLVIWHGRPALDRERDGELYHLATDPDELFNLFHDPAQAGQKELMMARLLDVLDATEDRSQPRVAAW
jgi:arylsulfatase